MENEYIEISVSLIRTIMKEKVPKNSEANIIIATPTETILSYSRSCGCCSESINLYQFLNKCKEWIMNSGYSILENSNNEVTVIRLAQSGLVVQDFEPTIFEKAIVHCAEWVLVNKGKKGTL